MNIVKSSEKYTNQEFTALSQNLAFLGRTSCKFSGTTLSFYPGKRAKRTEKVETC